MWSCLKKVLAGGKVTSAGIIIVKKGLIKSFNPHSGHYKTNIPDYKSFILQLENKGTDLSKVKIFKSLFNLWGLQKYSKMINEEKELKNRFKNVIGLTGGDGNENEPKKE